MCRQFKAIELIRENMDVLDNESQVAINSQKKKFLGFSSLVVMCMAGYTTTQKNSMRGDVPDVFGL